MIITVGSWIIPLVLSIILLIMIFRPLSHHGSSDYGQLFGGAFEALTRLFWLIPLCLVWLIYSIILLWT